jgi:tetratricopeptide (TPR) repeat protein
VRSGMRKSGLFVSGCFLWLCAILVAGGCGKKAIRSGTPFELDKVFTGQFSPRERDWKEEGMRLAKDKNFDEAIDAFKRYVVQQPDDFFGFNAIAVCYKNIGDHSQAMKNFERALEFAETSEDRAKVLANIGNLYFSANTPQAALGYYKEAAGEAKKNPLYLIFIARTFAVMNEPERARKVLVEAERRHKDLEKYERDDDRGLGSYLMAYSFLALNDEDKVFKYLENALKVNPEKYVERLGQDFSDEKSLLYTIRDDPRIRKAMKRYSVRTSRAP